MLYAEFILKAITSGSDPSDAQSEDKNRVSKLFIALFGITTIFVSIYFNPYHDNPLVNIGLLLLLGGIHRARQHLTQRATVSFGVTKDQIT